VEMARRRLSAKVEAGCVRAVESLADKSDSHQATELHGRLTGEGGLVGR